MKALAVVILMLVVFVGLRLSLTAKQNSPRLADAFFAKLTPEQQKVSVFPFEDENRTTWNYVPGVRKGLSLKAMSPELKAAALELLHTSLSESGFAKAQAIRTQIETTLRDMEGNPGRDPELYYVAFFGAPSSKGHWGWRFEGHHLSFNFTYLDRKVVATTPQFLGTNPAEVRQGSHKGLRVLDKEEDLGYQLVRSLTSEQREEAILAAQAPPEIITGSQRKVAILEDKGLAFSSMDHPQKELLRKLVKIYADIQRPEQAKARMAKIEKAGWDHVKFAWMGSLEPGQGHYYRIQGSTFLIELDNTQNEANHVHTVWRDFDGDFGRDALEEHYRTTEHHHP